MKLCDWLFKHPGCCSWSVCQSVCSIRAASCCKQVLDMHRCVCCVYMLCVCIYSRFVCACTNLSACSARSSARSSSPSTMTSLRATCQSNTAVNNKPNVCKNCLYFYSFIFPATSPCFFRINLKILLITLLSDLAASLFMTESQTKLGYLFQSHG